MTDSRKLGLAALLFTLLLVLLAAGARRTSFQTSALDLLPAGGNEVEVLRELAEKGQGRLLIVRLFSSDGTVGSEAADSFLQTLDKSPAIANSWIIGSEALEETGRMLFKQRYDWLLPMWLDENFPSWRESPGPDETEVAQRIVDGIDASLQSPEGFALSESIPSDPFLLIGYLYEAGGLLTDGPADEDVYLWVEQAASPFSDEGQGPVFNALEGALNKAVTFQQGLEMEYSGVSVFASASKAGIKKEIKRLNFLGAFLVLLIAIFAVRKVSTILRIGSVLLISLLAAASTTVLVFPQVHVIALVIGSVLVGIAVDYAFHLLLTESHGLPRETVTRAVIAGSGSSALGFIVLVLTPLPFLRQVGVFVGAGLIAALLVSLLLQSRTGATALSRKWQVRPFVLTRWTGPVFILLLLPGLFFLKWRDSITDLEFPLPALKEKEMRLRANSSGLGSDQALLAYGTDPMKARESLETVIGLTRGDALLHAGQWIPPYGAALETRRFFDDFPDFTSAIRRELAARDYIPDYFETFFTDWATYQAGSFTTADYSTGVAELSAVLPGPMRNFVHVGDNLSWFLFLGSSGENYGDIPGVLRLNQAEILSRSFSDYRKAVMVFTVLCLVVVLSGIVFIYGIQAGCVSLGIPATALLAAFGVLAFIHSGLGLFHLVGGMLAFFISLDYAIFAVQSHRRGCSMPSSVGISLLTTLSAFGLLSTSEIPGVHQLGLTVILVIGVTVLLVFAGWPLQGKRILPEKTLFNRLPHGSEALMVGRVLRLADREIEMDCLPGCHEEMPAESLIEAMAQAAATWMAATHEGRVIKRTGMLVVVQRCRIDTPLIAAGERPVTKVEALSDLREGLLLFKGECCDERGSHFMWANFSIFVPPREAPDGTENGKETV